MAQSIPLIERAREYAERTAVIAPEGKFAFGDLLDASARAAAGLLNGGVDLAEARVAFLVPSGFVWVATQWGIWRAGGIAVPLSPLHPPPELEYVIADADADIVVAHPDLADRIRPIVEAQGRRLLLTPDLANASTVALPEIAPDRRAMMLYTSGTTGRPKGVVTTHANIATQVRSLVEAWGWTADDHILLVLPLHHIHGIVNVVTCALASGAASTMMPRFDAGEVWRRFVEDRLTLFMAVPTIYRRLISEWETMSTGGRRVASDACRGLRLMVSGSAALPASVLERWREISGHVLLERYGMTEIGMALSNPLRGERRAGRVGLPLPRVEVRLAAEDGTPAPAGTPGEIEVRGPGVFREYWRRPEATREAFRDGWFRTGDVAVLEDGGYRILGRRSVDIIKTGGYKVSALEIEEVLREHPDIRECAVVGVPDPEWGERVCAALVMVEGAELSLVALRAWTKERLAACKAPSRVLILDALPCNAMGKVRKPRIAELFGSGTAVLDNPA